MDCKDTCIIQREIECIAEISKKDVVKLVGEKYTSDINSEYFKNVRLEINLSRGEIIREELEQFYTVIQMKLVDFVGNGIKDIIILGEGMGETKKQEVVVYRYSNKRLIKLLSNDLWRKQEDYMEQVIEKLFLQPINIGEIQNVYIIEPLLKGEKQLLLQQSVINGGIKETETILESKISFNCEGYLVTERGISKSQAYLELDDLGIELRQILLMHLPEDVKLVKFEGEYGKREFLECDLDGDGIDEILVNYISNDRSYLALMKRVAGELKLLDTIAGNEKEVEQIQVIHKNGKHIVYVGWHTRNQQKRLDVLKVTNQKFVRVLRDKTIYYDQLEITKLMPQKEEQIITWTQTQEGAYEIEIFEWYGHTIIATTEYDLIYYPKVIDYYVEQLKENPQSTVFRYYLAKAYYKVGDMKGTIKMIQEALKLPNPYPSERELKQFNFIVQHKK